jgi:DNA-3-methyladenine glycosylase II
MFAIFSLRRPDILPIGMTLGECFEALKLTFVGDLGVQRGLLRWILSLHQPEFRIEISPTKLPDPNEDPQKAKDKPKPKPKPTKLKKKTKGVSASAEIDSDKEAEPEADELPSLNGQASTIASTGRAPTPPLADASSDLPAVAKAESDVLGTPLNQRRHTNVVAAGPTPGALGLPSMPPPLTPSVNQVLSRAPDAPPPPPLPTGLTVASLKSRLDGKKKIKCVNRCSDEIVNMFITDIGIPQNIGAQS